MPRDEKRPEETSGGLLHRDLDLVGVLDELHLSEKVVQEGQVDEEIRLRVGVVGIVVEHVLNDCLDPGRKTILKTEEKMGPFCARKIC